MYARGYTYYKHGRLIGLFYFYYVWPLYLIILY